MDLSTGGDIDLIRLARSSRHSPVPIGTVPVLPGARVSSKTTDGSDRGRLPLYILD